MLITFSLCFSFKDAPIAPIVFKQLSSSLYIHTTYWNFVVCSVGVSPIVYAKAPSRGKNRMINREGDLNMLVEV